MKYVIQCAAGKYSGAGTLNTPDGIPVLFVADPEQAPKDRKTIYARPDDLFTSGLTWRNHLLDYNNNEKDKNPLDLRPAYQLYANSIYHMLVEKFGLESVFILSAGWGLIPAGFLIPNYDITFSSNADPYKRRQKSDVFDDFSMLPDGDDVVFVGGKSYLNLFCQLTINTSSTKTVYYNSLNCPDLPSGFNSKLYKTRTRTNWHYECAQDLIKHGGVWH